MASATAGYSTTADSKGKSSATLRSSTPDDHHGVLEGGAWRQGVGIRKSKGSVGDDITRLVIKKNGIILPGKSHEPSRWGDDVTARVCWRTLGKIGHALDILKQWIF